MLHHTNLEIDSVPTDAEIQFHIHRARQMQADAVGAGMSRAMRAVFRAPMMLWSALTRGHDARGQNGVHAAH